MALSYALILVTHGESPTLHTSVASFNQMVRPVPSRRIAVIDGSGTEPLPDGLGPWEVARSDQQYGFCETTRRAWQLAADADLPFVFHLEGDFVFLKPVDLEPLTHLLDSDHGLVQVQLLRDSVNAEERRAGGVIQKHIGRGDEFVHRDGWIEHSAYLTTNPSLMRRAFMAENPWPDEPSECEGRFGLALVERGYRYAIWGDGRPLVRHIGRRHGKGY